MQPSRRPKDGRYGDNPNRLQHYYQYQVGAQARAGRHPRALPRLASRRVGFDLRPTTSASSRTTGRTRRWAAGAWAGRSGSTAWRSRSSPTSSRSAASTASRSPARSPTAWSAWRCTCRKSTRLRPGLDRRSAQGRLSYGDVYQNEVEQSTYNFEHSDVEFLLAAFAAHERQSQKLMASGSRCRPEQLLKAGHSFNLLDARGAISVTRARRLHRAHPRPRARGGAELPRQPRPARLPDGAARLGGCRRRPASSSTSARRMSTMPTRSLLVEALRRGTPPKGTQGRSARPSPRGSPTAWRASSCAPRPRLDPVRQPAPARCAVARRRGAGRRPGRTRQADAGRRRHRAGRCADPGPVEEARIARRRCVGVAGLARPADGKDRGAVLERRVEGATLAGRPSRWRSTTRWPAADPR